MLKCIDIWLTYTLDRPDGQVLSNNNGYLIDRTLGPKCQT